ncbi:hypothetical protein FOA22_22865 [Heyndrickxia oleronia]|uniref:hypothetical protein n=1 Tax=Heyndrickxia oleronia TaxID=38875 RepID=UPI0033373203
MEHLNRSFNLFGEYLLLNSCDGGINIKTKKNWLGFGSLFLLVLGIISLFIANSVHKNYGISRNNLLNMIEVNNLSTQQIDKIGNAVKEINNRFHTDEYIAIYTSKDNKFSKVPNYSFPSKAQLKDNLLTRVAYPIERYNEKNFFVVHQYFPDWYYLFPISLFSLSAIFLIIWTAFQVKLIFNHIKNFKLIFK